MNYELVEKLHNQMNSLENVFDNFKEAQKQLFDMILNPEIDDMIRKKADETSDLLDDIEAKMGALYSVIRDEYRKEVNLDTK